MLLTLPTIRLENFEGPFDLLLELVRARKFDITTISLAAITADFLSYVKKHSLPASVQADFLTVAAALLSLKALSLLPGLSIANNETVAAGTLLASRLRLYTLYRQQAQHLRHRSSQKWFAPGIRWLATPFPPFTPRDLSQALTQLIKRLPRATKPIRSVQLQGKPIEHYIALFERELQRLVSFVFQEKVGDKDSSEQAASFMALLELTRHGKVHLHQEQPFAPLVVTRHD